jgi:iron complex transport system substrate-binding protein
VSLTPTITETLFALGAGEQVVGVTRFCNHPPEARTRPTVGGLIDIDVEAVLVLRPDLVIAEPQQAVVGKLRQLGVTVLTVETQAVSQLLESFRIIGRRVGHGTEAETLVRRIRQRTAEVAKAVAERPRPRVLLVVGRNPLVAAGRGTFLDELITAAGGTNIVGDSERPYPTVSLEKVLLAQPEVIVECSGSMVGEDMTAEARRAWARWPSLSAVSSGRVYVSHSDAMLRPGPRVVAALDELVRYLHPEIAERLREAESQE